MATEAFYPLTLPLTVGPGSISVAITIGANHPQTVRSFVTAALSSLLGVILICITIYLCYRYAQRLSKLLGGAGTAVVVRLSAFILLCIGVQIMWNGLDALTRDHRSAARSGAITRSLARGPASAIMIRLCSCTCVEAGVAQLVEQRIRNAKVGSSTLFAGTRPFNGRDFSAIFFVAFGAGRRV